MNQTGSQDAVAKSNPRTSVTHLSPIHCRLRSAQDVSVLTHIWGWLDGAFALITVQPMGFSLPGVYSYPGFVSVCFSH